MTPDDLAAMSPDGLDSRLAAIRARDAAAIFTTFTDLTLYQQSIRDRRALLAEVDRLEVALEREMDASNAALADVDRLYGVVDDVYRAVNEAEIAERARIRAAVEGLVPVMVRKDMLKPEPKWDDMVTRAAVLALLDAPGGEG